MTRPTSAADWWRRPGLDFRHGELHLGRQSLARLAEELGTPLYAYHGARIRANLRRLRAALRGAARASRIFYAMKSNRYPPLLSALAASGGCGVDVCSPDELALARRAGFPERDISYTGTSFSERDAQSLARHPRVHLNCDSLSSLRRIARLSPGREVGLRINPGLGIGYRRNAQLRYAGARATKFGLYREQFGEALALARESGLKIVGLHVHSGCGFLTPQLGTLDRIFSAVRPFLRAVADLRYLNLGGGLGIPLAAGDRPLDLDAWSRLIRRHFGRDTFEIWVEPGDYLVKDAGVLLLQVTQVEIKQRTRFVGLDGGFNLHPEPAFYDLPLEPVPCRPRAGAGQTVTIAGNINEALDLWAESIALPPLEEGDFLALLNAGGYGASMSSNHCMRGKFVQRLLP